MSIQRVVAAYFDCVLNGTFKAFVIIAVGEGFRIKVLRRISSPANRHATDQQRMKDLLGHVFGEEAFSKAMVNL